MADALSPRRGRILKHVVEEYVTTAQPVSSDVLVRKYVQNVSTATVRNEMAALEGFGYLYHPHTSAGRIPSDMGYRYYVEWLMVGARLSEADERMISHQFHQVELHVSEWLSLASSLLMSRLQNPVMIVPPVAQMSRLRRLDLVQMGGSLLVVILMRSGAMRQRALRMVQDFSEEGLRTLASDWNLLFAGKSSAELRALALSREQEMMRDALAEELEEADRESAAGADVRVAGLSYIAAQPEFGSSDRLRPVVEALERDGVLASLMEPLLQSAGVYVAIGHEQPLVRLRECTIVLCAYGRPNEMLGVVGVIGPTRFPYWRAVPAVRYIAGILDQLLDETFLA